MRRALLCLLVLAGVGVAGCGAVDDAREEADRRIAQVRDTARKVRADLREIRDDVRREVNERLADIRGVLPRADAETQPPVRLKATPFTDFLDEILVNVDAYWARTLTVNGLPRSRVRHRWIDAGSAVRTACNAAADDQAAFYCPADDTIYLGVAISRDILQGTGDFGVAYVVAHEYAHNVQAELGWFDEGPEVTTVAPFELQADCMAGAWGYAVYEQGRLEDGDVEEAVNTAFAVGDFDTTNPQHHGTPVQRSDAWVSGYESGDPSSCRRFTVG